MFLKQISLKIVNTGLHIFQGFTLTFNVKLIAFKYEVMSYCDVYHFITILNVFLSCCGKPSPVFTQLNEFAGEQRTIVALVLLPLPGVVSL